MLALAVVVTPKTPGPEQQRQRAHTLLRAAGFTALSVQPNAQNELVVSGYLDTQAQRVRAEELLAREGLNARAAFWVNEQIVGAVQDVYRVNGVTAQVQAAGAGAVRVSTSERDAATLQRIEAIARRDVAGLSRLDSDNKPPARTPSPIPVIDDPGKRIVSIVGGAAPYIRTEDGAHYAVGTLLPTGHRIVSIDAQTVHLEREGQHSSLTF
jgi:type III secretion protein D